MGTIPESVDKHNIPAVDTNRIPKNRQEFHALAAFAEDTINPESPEFNRVVWILRIAANRIEQLRIK